MLIKRIIPAVGLLVILLMSPLSHAQDIDWLIGNWLLTHDPDDDPQDMLTFKQGGEFITTDVVSNRQVRGVYLLKSDKILINLFHNGKMVMSANLTFDDKKDKLYYKSKKTGNTSHYTKVN